MMRDKRVDVTGSQRVLERARLLYSADQVEQAITEMAENISDRLKQSLPLVLPVMIGGIILSGKLLPQLHFPLQVDYIHATRYQGDTKGGKLSWLKKPTQSLANRVVLLLDDILDQGITLASLVEYCYQVGAKKVFTAVLVDRKLAGANVTARAVETADFTGLSIVTVDYVFGYGMDYHEYHRNVAGIYAVET